MPEVSSGARWLDGDEFLELQWFLDAAVASAITGLCVVCGAEQPDDVRWMGFKFELRSKADGEHEPAIEFRACQACEAKVVELFEALDEASGASS